MSADKFTEEKAREPGYYPAIVAQKALAVSPLMMNTFRTAIGRGVKVAFGTDAGVFPHGDNAKEFAYMIEGGMTPMAAIQSATMNASQLLGMEKNLGTLEAGKFADLIAVAGNPVEDITELQRVKFVMKDGQIVVNK